MDMLKQLMGMSEPLSMDELYDNMVALARLAEETVNPPQAEED